MQPQRRAQSGNYSMMIGVALPVFIGFIALSVDAAWIQMANSQSQDVADAAAHAALIEYRRTGSTTDAQTAAQQIVDFNAIGESNGDLLDVRFGEWSRGGAFKLDGEVTNAVEVDVGRVADNPLPLFFAKMLGRNEAEVSASATTASRSLHAVLVMDITASFRYDIHFARDGAVSFLDIIHDSSTVDDRVGMTTFFSRYSHVWTPMVDVNPSADYNTTRAQWSTFTWGHTAHDDWDGDYIEDHPNMGYYGETYYNDSPQMPWYFGDDWGTDHSVGMKVGIDMLLEEAVDDAAAYRALIILTDGKPVGLRNTPIRRPDDLDEGWTMWKHGDATRSSTKIVSEAQAQADRAEDNRINVWTVSLGDTAQGAFMETLVRGDGKSFQTSNPAELEPIFKEIAVSLPMLIVD